MQVLWLILQVVVYVLLQRFLFGYLALGDIAMPKPYILFILYLPIAIPRTWGLFIAFGFGLFLDIMMTPIGLNAFACTMLYFLREYWLRAISPQGALDGEESFDLRTQSADIVWFTMYLLPMAFVFELVYYSMLDLGLTGHNLLQIIASTFYTFIINVLIGVLVYRKTTRSLT